MSNNIYDEFFTYFNIEKVEYETPGRDWDNEGLASWYIEKDWPSISGDVYVGLLDIFLNIKKKNGSVIQAANTIELQQEMLHYILGYAKSLEDNQGFIQDVQDVFEF